MIPDPDRGYPEALADEEGWVLVEIWHLHSVDWIRELSDEDVEKLRAASAYRDYRAGETIFAPERDPHSVYLLERGLVRIYRLSSEGSETTFGYVAPGEVFGELSVFGDYPRESFAEALLDSRVWKMRSQAFRQILDSRPSIMLPIARQMGERLKSVESRVENLVFCDVGSRLAAALVELMRSLGRKDGSGTLIDVPVTQSELASLIGSTRQSVNVALRDLVQEGLIERRGRSIWVLQPDGLQRSAEAGSDRLD